MSSSWSETSLAQLENKPTSLILLEEIVGPRGAIDGLFSLSSALWPQNHRYAADAPFAVGHFIGESDTVQCCELVEISFAPANWRRLETLHAKRDLQGLLRAQLGML